MGTAQAQAGQSHRWDGRPAGTLVRNRLKSLQYRPATLDGFMTETKLGLPP
ncbi:hypothetical protein [Streptomyces sp. NPDC050388]|uniref:hypothetical protein n=1 Tax=Streptomyces sp. NPDC050388 TaxID=3155781 RepID=UPI0034315E5B